MHQFDPHHLNALAQQIQTWAHELGFQGVGITDVNLDSEKNRYQEWLERNYHGDMNWLADNVDKRFHPEKLVPHTQRIISVRMDYLPGDTQQIHTLKDADKAYVSRYALGRDYHKLIRKRLARLADHINQACQDLGNELFIDPDDTGQFNAKNAVTHLHQRPFVDSAPVLERPLAAKSGLGWVGKHTLILNEHAGSWFFLGELFTSLPLPINDQEAENKCGTCTACLKVCPTDAFPKPYQLDATRCISYLTIENKAEIPIEFREAIGNRVFGCDDCQAICPWNKFAKPTCEKDFKPRHGLDDARLLDLFNWDEATFLKHTEGSAIRRIGYERWLRNLAIGLGNSTPSDDTIQALKQKRPDCSALVKTHIDWAIAQLQAPQRSRKRKIKRARPAEDDS